MLQTTLKQAQGTILSVLGLQVGKWPTFLQMAEGWWAPGGAVYSQAAFEFSKVVQNPDAFIFNIGDQKLQF